MLEEYLRHFVNANKNNWLQLLDVAQFCSNTQKIFYTSKSAFEIATGQQTLLPLTMDEYSEKNLRAFNFTKEWKMNIKIARAYLEKALKRKKKWTDQGRRSLDFQSGDKVLIKLRTDQL